MEAMEIRYLHPEETLFSITAGGFLSMTILPDESYPIVHLIKSLPFTNEREYISVRDKEGKEIGIIRKLDSFSETMVEIMEIELQRRYFTPIITKINTVKEEFGYTYWEVLTESGPKRFTTRSGHNQVLQLNDNRILVIDLDGNRFEISNYKALDDKNERVIESLL